MKRKLPKSIASQVDSRYNDHRCQSHYDVFSGKDKLYHGRIIDHTIGNLFNTNTRCNPPRPSDTEERCLLVRKDVAVCATVPKTPLFENALITPEETQLPCHTVFVNPHSSAKVQVCAPSKQEAHLSTVALAEHYVKEYAELFSKKL